MTEQVLLRRNFRLLYGVNFFATSHFTLPIYILFGREYLHLSYVQAGSFFLVSLFVSLAFDFFGGVTADTFGRRRAFVVGMLLQIVGLLPFIFIKSYPLLLAFSVLAGFGMALVSNSLDALIYEQAKELGEEKYYQHGNAVSQSFIFAGRVWASILGGFVYLIHPTVPYVLSTLALICALLIGMQTRFTTKEMRLAGKTAEISKAAFRTVWSSAGLATFALIMCLVMLWADLLFVYYQPLYYELNVSTTTLGFVFAAISICSGIGAWFMRKLPDHLSAHAINTIIMVSVIITALLLLTFKVPIIFIAPLVLGVASGFMFPNLRLYVNKQAPNRLRASVLSVVTTAAGVGTGVGMLAALVLADAVQPATILWVVIVGSVLTIALNVILNLRQARKATGL